jgi:hypothetical protein
LRRQMASDPSPSSASAISSTASTELPSWSFPS